MADRQPIQVTTDGKGSLFKDTPDDLRGGVRIEGETFQFTAKVETSKNGNRYFKIIGTGEYGDSIDGALFEKAPGVGASGKPKPVFSGEVKTRNNKGEYELAVWEETSAKGNTWYSMKASVKQDRAAQSA